MTGGIGEFLLAAAEWAYEFFPARIVSDWQQGVRVRAGRATALLTATNGLFGSGLHFFWPILGEVQIESVTIRVTETETQRLVTRDGEELSCSFTVTYRLKDLRAFWLKVDDGDDDAVLDRVRGAAGIVVPSLTWAEVPERLREEIEAQAKKRIYGWGVDLLEVAPANLTRAPALHVVS